MAEETQTKAEEAVVVETEKETAPPAPLAEVPEMEEPIKSTVVEEAVDAATITTEESEKSEATEVESIGQAVTFQEESNVVADLPDPEKKALEELMKLIQEMIQIVHTWRRIKVIFKFIAPPPPVVKEERKFTEEEKKAETKEAPAPAEEKSDTTEDATAEAPTPTVMEEPPKLKASDVAESTLTEKVKKEKKEEVTPPEPESTPGAMLSLKVEFVSPNHREAVKAFGNVGSCCIIISKKALFESIYYFKKHF
ncbi:patellin-2-like [Telopea speciosissima]|uniref:patellin-2-like n=1 Tax=Telopea speciosissima TaxID=54955 RepID=UPI001CC6D6A1|nr:patellin-2-like [Telopea speciosissima]